MLFLVIFVSFPYAWLKLLPSEFIEYAESILASLFFGSNFFFYFSTTEYGADSALLKPFLHTWSLGVEEQFYLVFPALALIAFKRFRRYFLAVLVVLSLLSLQFAELMEATNSALNFYLPFSRFWELAVGSVLAFRELDNKDKRDNFFAQLLPMIGLCLIVYAIVFFDSKTPHPGFHTFIPILGVALIIGFATKNVFVGKILGSKPFVWVGLISYSAYLWHFPIFAFSRLGSSAHTNYDKFEWIGLTFVLSVVSYIAIEKPFRTRVTLRWLGAFIGVSLIVSTGGAIYVIQGDGLGTVARLGFNANIVDTIRPNYLFGDEGCGEYEVYLHNDTTFCIMGAREKDVIDFILVGDSHAMHAQPTLDRLSNEFGLKGLFGGNSGCPALLGVYPVRGEPHPNAWSRRCFGFNQNAYDLVKKLGIKTVFLISRWDYYVDGSNVGALNNITDVGLEIGDVSNARRVYDEAVTRTVARYAALGVRVVGLLQVPHQNINVKRIFEDLMSKPTIADRMQFINKSKNSFLALSSHRSRQFIANESWLKQSESISQGSLVVIDPAEEFCD
jgi:peptidoglycan/LPS O-acetylase OafA/YrhL